MAQAFGELFERAEEKRGYSARRSQLEIQMDILKVVHEGACLPTQIMYRANLAWVALQNNLGSLVGRGLLERSSEGGKRMNQLTMKGAGILTSFNLVMEAVQTPGVLRFGAG